MLFSLLGLHPALICALTDMGCDSPTAIQAQAIPGVLLGRDMVAIAQTGSGKTLAFALPLLQRLAKAAAMLSDTRNRLPRVLVLVPTRELGLQVGEIFKTLARHLPTRVKVSVLFGGVSINPQMLHLRGGADVVVATPGRLLDLLGRGALRLAQVDTVVLDEADRLLDLGFGDELAQILALLPAKRQSLFFSATLPPGIEALANQLLHEPLRFAVDSPDNRPEIMLRAIEVDAPQRTRLLRHLIDTEKWSRILVFVATRHQTETVSAKLRKAEIAAEPFHGELSQGKRQQVLLDFKAENITVMVATDVAARGLDIVHLPVVVNYDLPRSTVDFTHRIGRTGRAGKAGLAVSFITEEATGHYALIEKRQGVQTAREQVEGFAPAQPFRLPVDATGVGGVKGRGPSKKDKLREAAKSHL